MLNQERAMSRLINIALTVLLVSACADGDVWTAPEAIDNPFTDPALLNSKNDSFYYNPEGIEVEVEIEGDVKAWGNSQYAKAPGVVGQFALTYLRNRRWMYLESLAEDVTSKKRVEWLVDGEWVAAGDADNLSTADLGHFRIRGMNAVLLHGAADDVQVGNQLHVPVPYDPFRIMQDAGTWCADEDAHMTLSQSIYWYMWNPDKDGCDVEKRDLTLTVTKVLPVREATYPEYDKLVEDGKVTAVVLFGQIGHDDQISDNDAGMNNLRRMKRILSEAGFDAQPGAPVGERYAKQTGNVTFEIDLYSPHDFAGLSDYTHINNFERAIEEHEIVIYDGHSMMGASNFWSRPEYPEFYQIFVYGGCLGYQYYIRPILEGKGGDWSSLDLVSSVIEVSVGADRFAAPLLAKIAQTLETGELDVTWEDILSQIRRRVGDSTFGVSGVRDNCYTPDGTTCEDDPFGDPFFN
jgi:hypothetical protein